MKDFLEKLTPVKRVASRVFVFGMSFYKLMCTLLLISMTAHRLGALLVANISSATTRCVTEETWGSHCCTTLLELQRCCSFLVKDTAG